MSAQTIQSLLCVLVSLVTASCFGLLFVLVRHQYGLVIDVVRDVVAERLLRRRFGIYLLPLLYGPRFEGVVAAFAFGALAWGIHRGNTYAVSVATTLFACYVLEVTIRVSLRSMGKIALMSEAPKAPVVDAEFEA